MTCPSQLIRARYADGDLSGSAAEAFQQHLDGCARCRDAVADLVQENQALRGALKAADADGVIPAFLPRPTIGAVAAWVGCLAIAAWAVDLAWTSATGAMPGWVDWFTPDVGWMGLEVLVGITMGLVTGSGEGLSIAAGGLGVLAVVIAAGLAVWLFGRVVGNSRSLCLALAGSLLLLTLAPTSQAFELRRDDDQVIVAASEVVDDTLMVSAERILIEGAVTGDLLVAGEQITIRGSVGGNLVAVGETLLIESEVGGNLITAGETIDLRGVAVNGNLFGAAGELTLHDDSSVGGNAAIGVGESKLSGQIGRDLWIATGEATLSGRVLGSIRAYAEKLTLTGSARVGGNLDVKVGPDGLKVEDGAEVGGETIQDMLPERPNRYLTVEYYVGIVLKLAAALLTGVVVFYLFPSLAESRLGTGMEVLVAAGFGLVALAATPIIALLVTATLVGAPLGLTLLLLYLVTLYLAGILTANQIGAVLMEGREGRVLPLFVGLAIVFVLVSLPAIGGVFRLVAMVIGLGLLLTWLRELWQARAA